MNTESLFFRLRCLEEESAQLYHELSQQTATVPKVQSLFQRLSKEEKSHSHHINMAKSYQSQAAEHFSIQDGALETVDKARNSLQKLRERMEQQSPSAPFISIMEEVLTYEQEMEASHYTNYMAIGDESLKNLLLQLSRFDKEHVSAISKVIDEIRAGMVEVLES